MAPAAAPLRRRPPRAVRVAVGAVAALVVVSACQSSPGDTSDRVPDVSGTAAGAAVGPAAEAQPPDPSPRATATPEVGALAAGFPTELVPVPDDAVFLVTSTVPVGTSDVREISLNVRTSMSTRAVARLYRDALTDAGFTEVEPVEPTTSLAAAMTFVRSAGDELLSVGVLDTDGARTISIGGRIRDADA